jgi:uncharacterized membrane protein
MEKYHVYFLIVHITAGMISLVMAPIAFMTLKGGPAHRRWGKVYFWCMAIVAITALTMSIYHHLAFLLMIAIFSFSSATRGYRSIYWKNDGNKKWLDWSIEIANGLVSLGLILFSWMIYKNGSGNASFVPLFFGIFGLRGSIMRMIRFVKPSTDKKAWLYEHIGNMSGSYIASVTAFLVNTAHFLPDVVTWLGPSVVGVPLIYFTIAKYKRKFSKGEKVELVETA